MNKLILAVLLLSFNLHAQIPNTLVHSIPGAPTSQAGDWFGSVALHGSIMAVGAPLSDVGATDSGSVYVYDLNGTNPTAPILTIHNPTPNTNDQFGLSVKISGSRLAVGAHLDDAVGSDAGTVYIYDLSNPTPTVPVAALYDPTPTGHFGFSVAISGSLVVVGANFDDSGVINAAGRVYVFDLNNPNPAVPAWILENPGPDDGDRFGRGVAIDGTLVAITVFLDDTGASDSGIAYVFDLSTATPTVPVATLNNPTPAATDWFGWTVCVSGTRVAVGCPLDNTFASDAGSAYVYDMSSATPATPVLTLNNPSPASGDNFGATPSISGNLLVVTAWLDDAGATDAGSAYVYDLAGASPTVPVATLNNPTPGINDRLQWAAIDGTTIVLGVSRDDTEADDKGAVYVYSPPPEIIIEQPTGTVLVDGSANLGFGNLAIGTSGVAKSFTIRNTGQGYLSFGVISKSGAHPGDFVINSESLAKAILPGNSTGFSVTFAPAGTVSGTRTASIQIANNDSDESPFDISLSGFAYSSTADGDGDGMNDWQEVQLAALGFNWQVNNASLVNTYFSTASLNGLYTETQIHTMNVNTPLLSKDPGTGKFKLNLGLQRSIDRATFESFPFLPAGTSINPQGEVEFEFSVPEDAAFFKIEAR